MESADWVVFDEFLKRTHPEFHDREHVSLLKEMFPQDLQRWRATALFHLGLPVVTVLSLIQAEPWRMRQALTNPHEVFEELLITELVEYTRLYNYALYGSETVGVDISEVRH